MTDMGVSSDGGRFRGSRGRIGAREISRRPRLGHDRILRPSGAISARVEERARAGRRSCRSNSGRLGAACHCSSVQARDLLPGLIFARALVLPAPGTGIRHEHGNREDGRDRGAPRIIQDRRARGLQAPAPRRRPRRDPRVDRGARRRRAERRPRARRLPAAQGAEARPPASHRAAGAGPDRATSTRSRPSRSHRSRATSRWS